MKKIKILQLLANNGYESPKITFENYVNFYIDRTFSYKEFLEKNNNKKSYYIKNNSIFLRPGKLLHLDFQMTVGMPKGYYFQVSWPSIFDLSELYITSSTVFYGRGFFSNLALTVFNPTKHKIEIKLDEPFVRGAIYKGKNAKRIPIKDWNIISGISRSEFFKRVEDFYGKEKSDKYEL